MLTAADIHRVTDQLQYFGCNPRETQIYLECLQIGPASVQKIAKRMRQNRVTIHSAVEQMLRKGLLFETRRKRRRLIVAEEPVGLFRLLQKKENELHAMRSHLDGTIRLLTSLQAVNHSIPTVRLYEGVEGFQQMLEETLQARSEILVFTYVDLFANLLGEKYLEDYYRRRAEKGIHTRLIFPDGLFGRRTLKKASMHNMQIRFLPKTMIWQSGIFSWNDSLALMSYTKQKLTTTIIENRDIAHFYRSIIFEICWKQALSPGTAD